MNKEKFNKLPKNKKARLVAHDVIANVITKPNVKSATGSYIYYPGLDRFKDLSFQNIKNNECEVCAKGAAIYSYFSLTESNEDCSIYPFSQSSDLYDLFGEDFHLMEYVFEKQNYYYGSKSVAFALNGDETFNSFTIENFYDLCEKLEGDTYKNAIEQIMRNYLLNDTIDLSNHPAPQEEIYVDEASGTVTICDTYSTIDLTQS